MSEKLRSIPAFEAHSPRRRTAALTGLALATALTASSCGENFGVKLGNDASMGPLPDDICIRDGRPEILGVTSQTDGGVTLSYLRNDGALVSVYYLNFPTGYEEKGKFIWDENPELCSQ